MIALALTPQGQAPVAVTPQPAETLVAFERATMLDPNYGAAWRNRALTLNELKRYQEALAAADRAVAIEPTNSIGYTRRAEALRGLGREAEAQEAERRAKGLGG